MPDRDRLAERVREMSKHDHDEHELKLADRPPPSEAQRRRVEAVAEGAEPAGEATGDAAGDGS